MNTRRLLLSVVLVTLLLTGRNLSPAAYAALPSARWGDGPLLFIENVGQFHPEARFQVRGGGITFWLTDDAIWFTILERRGRGAEEPRRGPPPPLRSPAPPLRRAVHLKLSFPNAAPHPRLEPFAPQDVVFNYYRGNDPSRWYTHVPVYAGVRYVALYPGVDLVVGGGSAPARPALPWRLEVRDGADLSAIRLRVEGAERVTVEGGRLRLSTALGDLSLPLPGLVGGHPTGVPAVVDVDGAAFEVASPYAAVTSSGPLAPLDNPDALLLGTYIGGSDYDEVNAVAADGSGAVYVTGATFSPNFPTEGPGATSSLNGNCDMFIAKLARRTAFFQPVYSTYLGGSYDDPGGAYEDFFTESGRDITVEEGAAYVAGSTWSDDFPTTAGAYDTTFNGPAVSPDASPDRPGSDGVVVKLDADGNLVYATYLGGSGFDYPDGGRGGGDDEARGIAVRNGVIYVTGFTGSSDFPTTAGAFDRTYANVDIGLNEDVFVTKLNPAGNGSADLLYSTFIGGGMTEKGNDIVVDEAGLVYVTGYADNGSNASSDFPTTPGAFDSGLGEDDKDAFLLKMNPAGNGTADLLYSTFLGGERDTGVGWDYGHALAVDEAGYVYIVGSTDSPDFPTTPGAFDTTCGTDGNCNYVAGWGAADDVFIAKLNPAGGGASDLLYATFLGGGHIDGWIVDWADIVLDDAGDVYVTGLTYSDDFPTADAYDGTLSGDTDAFVTRLRLQGRGQEDLVYSTFLGGSGKEYGQGIALESEGVVWVAGETSSSNFPVTDDGFDRFYNGGYDGFIVKMAAPAAPDLSTSAKTVAPDAAAAGEVVTFTVRLANTGLFDAAAALTDTLPVSLLLQGSPTASSGPAPTVNGQTITWSGTVTASGIVTITYATLLTSTTVLTPTAVNEATIADGVGNRYLRRAFVNGHRAYLPLVMRNR